MLKRYSVETKLVKTNKKQESPMPTATPEPTQSWIDKIQRKDVVRVAVGVVVTYASVVAINTASTIAINYAPKQ